MVLNSGSLPQFIQPGEDHRKIRIDMKLVGVVFLAFIEISRLSSAVERPSNLVVISRKTTSDENISLLESRSSLFGISGAW